MYEPPQIIREISPFLQQELPDTKAELITYLRGVDGLRLKLAEAIVDWQKLLHEKRSQMLHPKGKEFTEMDRKIQLNASVAIIERDAEFLARINTIVEDRLQFGRQLLTLL